MNGGVQKLSSADVLVARRVIADADFSDDSYKRRVLVPSDISSSSFASFLRRCESSILGSGAEVYEIRSDGGGAVRFVLVHQRRRLRRILRASIKEKPRFLAGDYQGVQFARLYLNTGDFILGNWDASFVVYERIGRGGRAVSSFIANGGFMELATGAVRC